jgi:hypothetical protein
MRHPRVISTRALSNYSLSTTHYRFTTFCTAVPSAVWIPSPSLIFEPGIAPEYLFPFSTFQSRYLSAVKTIGNMRKKLLQILGILLSGALHAQENGYDWGKPGLISIPSLGASG